MVNTKSINNTPTEHEEQVKLVQWLTERDFKFSSIPNATYTKSWYQKHKNKAEGLNSGLPDLLVILPAKMSKDKELILVPSSLLFIEMKRLKGSVTSPEQKEWIKELNKIPNVEAVVAKGANEAIAIVESFL